MRHSLALLRHSGECGEREMGHGAGLFAGTFLGLLRAQPQLLSGQLAPGLRPLLERASFAARFKDTMINTVGFRATERSLQLGLLHSAPEAFKIGLVDQLVPEEKLPGVAAEVMSQWLTVPGESAGERPRPPLCPVMVRLPMSKKVKPRQWKEGESSGMLSMFTQE